MITVIGEYSHYHEGFEEDMYMWTCPACGFQNYGSLGRAACNFFFEGVYCSEEVLVEEIFPNFIVEGH